MSENFLVILRDGIEAGLLVGIAVSLLCAALRGRAMTEALVPLRVRGSRRRR